MMYAASFQVEFLERFYASQVDKEQKMADTSVTKVQSSLSPHGSMGQKYLATGLHVSLRLWEKQPAGESYPTSTRDYETVGYVIEGRAELEIEGQRLILEAGDSWTVPRGASHRYVILEELTAVEATSPPAFAHGRDEEDFSLDE